MNYMHINMYLPKYGVRFFPSGFGVSGSFQSIPSSVTFRINYLISKTIIYENLCYKIFIKNLPKNIDKFLPSDGSSDGASVFNPEFPDTITSDEVALGVL